MIEKKVTPPPPKKKQNNPSSSNKNKFGNKTQLKNLSNRYPLNFMENENQKDSETKSKTQIIKNNDNKNNIKKYSKTWKKVMYYTVKL